MAINAALAYKENQIKTASKGELTLMLYEGAIRFCNVAITAINDHDIAQANINIKRAQNIITELRATLKPEYKVSEHFEAVYDYIYRRLIEANVKKDVEILEEANQYIREMRDTWKEVMRKTKA